MLATVEIVLLSLAASGLIAVLVGALLTVPYAAMAGARLIGQYASATDTA